MFLSLSLSQCVDSLSAIVSVVATPSQSPLAFPLSFSVPLWVASFFLLTCRSRGDQSSILAALRDRFDETFV
ncbi:hypothetical protein S83_065752 [Arachis hypogaea]